MYKHMKRAFRCIQILINFKNILLMILNFLRGKIKYLYSFLYL